jgi:hypothetical protein
MDVVWEVLRWVAIGLVVWVAAIAVLVAVVAAAAVVSQGRPLDDGDGGWPTRE